VNPAGETPEQATGPPLPLERRWPAIRALPARLKATLLQILDRDPVFRAVFVPAFVVAALLYTRSPLSNYIFDEQEALLANPYVNGRGLAFWQVLQVDFWGLPPDRSIGSYRPLPNLIWRALWTFSEAPWPHHFVNVVLHAVNAALVGQLAFRITRDRMTGWFAAIAFVTSAVLTETVSGVVGIADVLGGLGVLLGLLALRVRGPVLVPAVFGATLLGLLAKESALVAVPLLTWAALLTAPLDHPERPRRVLRACLAFAGASSAFVAYTYLRRHFFPVASPETLDVVAREAEPWVVRTMHAFLGWFQQPRLPHDPINNPFVDADLPHRIAGALRVYCRGLGQVLFPWRLSGDYSFPAEPVPARLVFPESVAGALALILPLPAAVAVWLGALRLERRRARRTRLGGFVLVALALAWVPIAYFPHSNIPLLLPTVRAERFWYLPVIATSLVLGLLAAALFRRRSQVPGVGLLLVAFFGFQAVRARAHALDYSDDLAFWRATRNAVPNSAKAQLNYSVMLGARGQLDQRLAASRRALELAPSWPMGHVYYADTLCRMKRSEQAFPHYRRGFELAPGDQNLIALGLQCLWDQGAIRSHERELLDLADRHPGSWLAYLAHEIVHNGDKHKGVEARYRPRSYDEGPKD
jgi:tetratricopeptide (TPR) repeat protein